MAVYTEKKTYHTKAHMGMIDVTEDFQHAVEEACRQHGISAGTVTGFTTGGVAGLTTLEFEPGIVNHDLKAALDVFSPTAWTAPPAWRILWNSLTSSWNRTVFPSAAGSWSS